MEGFIPISRRFFSHFLWEEERTYSKAEAWLDLIQMAAFRSHERIIGATVVNVERGGIVASERFLSLRWQWSRTKIRDFLSILTASQMVNIKKDQAISIINLCNFDQYNSDMFTEEPQKNPKKTAKEPGRDQEETKENKGKKEEQGKEEVPPSPQAGAAVDPLRIPSELHSPEFTATWQRWMEFRRGFGQKPKSWAILFGEQLTWLKQFGASTGAEMLQASMRNGWQGIFELKTPLNPSQAPKNRLPESNQRHEVIIPKML